MCVCVCVCQWKWSIFRITCSHVGVDLKAQLQDSFLATLIKMSLKCFLKITQPELQGKTLFTETITKKEEITRNQLVFVFVIMLLLLLLFSLA